MAGLGRSWVFWPVLLSVVLLGRPWSPRWTWLVALVVVGPVLALVLRSRLVRALPRPTVGPRAGWVLALLRGERPRR